MYTYKRSEPQKAHTFDGYMVDEASTIKTFDYASIHRSKEFEEAMKYFDKEDDMTRNILLSVNEADQTVVMQSLSNRLYQHIVDKVDDIDFGTIPDSKGDVTKIDNYDNLVDCINIISEVLTQYHQDVSSIETVRVALQNMIDRKDFFVKAYKLNVEMPMIIYNTIVLGIVSSVSFMISTCIEFVKLPDDEGIQIAIDKAGMKKSKEYMMFTDLKKFNKLCANGDFDKAMDYIVQGNTKNFTGAALGASSIAVILGIILLIIPVIREMVFFFYYSRTKVADYFEAQASLLQVNAYNLENNLTRDEESRKEIAGKQRKVADAFRKIADTLKIKSKKAEQDSQKEIKKLDSEKYKAGDVLDKMPDSSNSVLF